eukprot:TRINITY_DN8112_c0_g1_i2.p2 TRINITY_DN8112_c0_g1~~TRINITY_DN8112_c0_g1_i2.p2  ORF type:complete len:103 (-),score=13.49 TRINITY_DN8112_c0_g1_i2:1344-1652(-)
MLSTPIPLLTALLILTHPKHFIHSYLSIHEADESGEGHGGLVDFAHEKPLQYHCIELASCPTHQEPVELDKELEVDIIGFGRSSFGLLAFATCYKIYTHCCC